MSNKKNNAKNEMVLVTGPDGLLGAHLVRLLLDRGYAVRAFVHPSSPSPILADLPIEIVKGDILAQGEIEKALDGCAYLIHAAAIIDQHADPDLVWKVNFDGAKMALDACVAKKIKRLVYVGSGSVFEYGGLDHPGDETGGFPKFYKGMAYMESKHRATRLVMDYVRDKGLDAVIGCPTFLLGGMDWRPSSGVMVRDFIKKELKISSGGGRNFTHVRDVAGALINALTMGRAGEAYILGGENIGYTDFITRVMKAAGKKPPLLQMPNAVVMLVGAAGSAFEKLTGRQAGINLWIARFGCEKTYYSSAKAETELGMTHTPVDTAIAECIECLKEYGHLD